MPSDIMQKQAESLMEDVKVAQGIFTLVDQSLSGGIEENPNVIPNLHEQVQAKTGLHPQFIDMIFRKWMERKEAVA